MKVRVCYITMSDVHAYDSLLSIYSKSTLEDFCNVISRMNQHFIV